MLGPRLWPSSYLPGCSCPGSLPSLRSWSRPLPHPAHLGPSQGFFYQLLRADHTKATVSQLPLLPWHLKLNSSTSSTGLTSHCRPTPHHCFCPCPLASERRPQLASSQHLAGLQANPPTAPALPSASSPAQNEFLSQLPHWSLYLQSRHPCNPSSTQQILKRNTGHGWLPTDSGETPTTDIPKASPWGPAELVHALLSWPGASFHQFK